MNGSKPECNEAFDLEVYALSALRTRGANYLRKALHAPVATKESFTGLSGGVGSDAQTPDSAQPNPLQQRRKQRTEQQQAADPLERHARAMLKKPSWGRTKARPWGR